MADFDDDYEQDFDDVENQEFDEEEEEVEYDDDEGFQEEEDDFGGEETTTEETEDPSEDSEGFDKPVEEGETVELEIEDLGSKGDGIARIEGFVIFVPGGEVGESYDVEITSVGRKFAFGEIAE